MPETLNQVLERFSSKLSYREMDKTALDISRTAATGSLGEREYSEWALISNDPLVVVNYVKTFITVLASKLSSAPFRPASDELNELVLNMRLNSQLTELYKMTLSDGYAFLGIGLSNGQPITNIIDARYTMYNGNDPTLKDATEIIVFEIMPRSKDDEFISSFPSGYIDFAPDAEKVPRRITISKTAWLSLTFIMRAKTSRNGLKYREWTEFLLFGSTAKSLSLRTSGIIIGDFTSSCRLS